MDGNLAAQSVHPPSSSSSHLISSTSSSNCPPRCRRPALVGGELPSPPPSFLLLLLSSSSLLLLLLLLLLRPSWLPAVLPPSRHPPLGSSRRPSFFPASGRHYRPSALQLLATLTSFFPASGRHLPPPRAAVPHCPVALVLPSLPARSAAHHTCSPPRAAVPPRGHSHHAAAPPSRPGAVRTMLRAATTAPHCAAALPDLPLCIAFAVVPHLPPRTAAPSPTPRPLATAVHCCCRTRFHRAAEDLALLMSSPSVAWCTWSALSRRRFC